MAYSEQSRARARDRMRRLRAADPGADARQRSATYREWRRKHVAEWRAANPEEAKDTSRRMMLRRKYGITPEDYDRLFDRQGGACAVCGVTDLASVPFLKRKHFDVDHCHKTGRVRGLLCSRCNASLGKFADCPERLERAVKYLRGELYAESETLVVPPGRTGNARSVSRNT